MAHGVIKWKYISLISVGLPHVSPRKFPCTRKSAPEVSQGEATDALSNTLTCLQYWTLSIIYISSPEIGIIYNCSWIGDGITVLLTSERPCWRKLHRSPAIQPGDCGAASFSTRSGFRWESFWLKFKSLQLLPGYRGWEEKPQLCTGSGWGRGGGEPCDGGGGDVGQDLGIGVTGRFKQALGFVAKIYILLVIMFLIYLIILSMDEGTGEENKEED